MIQIPVTIKQFSGAAFPLKPAFGSLDVVYVIKLRNLKGKHDKYYNIFFCFSGNLCKSVRAEYGRTGATPRTTNLHLQSGMKKISEKIKKGYVDVNSNWERQIFPAVFFHDCIPPCIKSHTELVRVDIGEGFGSIQCLNQNGQLLMRLPNKQTF